MGRLLLPKNKGSNNLALGQPSDKLWTGAMVTVQELSSILHVHPNTVRYWSDQGLLRTYRIGPRGDRRFRWEDINCFLNERKNDTNSGDLYKGRVLIVDDEHWSRSLLEDIVEAQGCEVISVENGERALEELVKLDFNLVFLALALPESDGLDVLRLVRAMGKNVIVAMLVGDGDGPLTSEAISLGPLILIGKPFNTAGIIDIVSLAITT